MGGGCGPGEVFRRVNHDVLMGRLAKRIEDKAMLRILRRYLEAGVMANGVVMERHMGTPQPSPLLANVLLDEVDKSETAYISHKPENDPQRSGGHI